MRKNYWYINCLLALFGLIAGSLFANIYCNNVNEQGAVFNEFISRMGNISFNKNELLSYILQERIKILVIFIVLSFTSLAVLARTFFVLAMGMFWGYMCSSMVMVYGVFGIIMFMVICLIAQGIFVLAVFTGMNSGRIFRKNRLSNWKVIYWMLVSVVIMVLAAFIELYLNINFTKYYYLM